MLNIIQGKPGSGKSFFAVKKIAELLINLVEDEYRTKQFGVRRVYTNIKINLEEIDTYIEEITHTGIKASKYIISLDNDFFWETGPDGKKCLCEWWDKFLDGAYIVIDEVQYYLASNSKDNKLDGYNKAFELYISTHRHKAQDLVFITQHTDNIMRSCLSMADGCYIVTNYKSFVLPLLGIPISDFDVVRSAWGNDYQAANVEFGIYVGRAFHRQNVEQLLLTDTIFKLYKSHNDNISTDRPKLNLSRLGSLFWLFRRHALQLSIKFIVLVGVCMALYYSFRAVPTAIGRLFLTPSPSSKVNVTITDKSTKAQNPIIKNNDYDVVCVTPDYIVLTSGRKIFVGEEYYYEDKIFKLNSINFAGGTFELSELQDAESSQN